jgi:hypothetical protein
LDNDGGPKCKAPGGPQTDDRVFLLSVSEAEYLFADDLARTTGFWWWLRSPGSIPSYASHVSNDGKIFTNGYRVNDGSSHGVRPVMWISLDP